MADNIVLSTNVGTGATLATDDVTDAGGAHYQYVKLADGTANSATVIAAGGGVEAAALRVTIANDSTGVVSIDDNGGAITVDGTVAATQSGAWNVTNVSGTVSLPTGASTAAKQPALGTAGTASADVISVQGIASMTALTVDGSGVTQPVSAASLPLPSGASTEATLSTLNGKVIAGAGTEAAAIRVTLPTDGTGVVKLGAGTAEIGKLAAGSAAIGSVSVTGTVTVGSHAVTNAGTFAVQSSGSVAHDGADSGNPVKIGGKAYAFDGTAPQTAVAEADRVNAIFTPEGRQYVESTHPNYWRASADYASAQTNATVKAAAGAGLKLYITDVIVSNGATAGNITLLDGSAGTVLLELYPAINGGLTHSFRTPLALTANTLLAITSTTVTTHSVTVSGFIAA